MNPRIGRPRVLSDAAVEDILSWHRNRRTLKQVARQHGVSPNTVRNLIRQHFPSDRARVSKEAGPTSSGAP
jgi:transposase-like protein